MSSAARARSDFDSCSILVELNCSGWALTPSLLKELKTTLDPRHALAVAVRAARAAGSLMRRNLRAEKKVNSVIQHDIKLELDVRCQKLIERTLLSSFPDTAVLGEEGTRGDIEAPNRWVVDPIDGTVNFTYGIPHACVSIALQTTGARKAGQNFVSYETQIGVVYDPFCDELWTAVRGGRAYLNGRAIHVSKRSRLDDRSFLSDLRSTNTRSI